MKAGCYTVVVVAGNATFLLPVTAWSHSAHSPETDRTNTCVISHSGSIGTASAPESGGAGLDSLLRQRFHMFVLTLAHAAGTVLSSLGLGVRATPMSHSLINS